MNKFRSVKGFVGEVIGEVRKSSWPTRQELMGSTIVVIVSVIMLGIYVGLSDWLLMVMLKTLIP
ncbi:preprotein translocase subunit SecE [Verrucomicrobiota bacterium]